MSVVYSFLFNQKILFLDVFVVCLIFFNFETDPLSVLRLANGNVPV